jgi:hypothetical protein
MNLSHNTTDPARAFLSSVAEARLEARRLGFRARRLEAQATKVTTALTGMPSGGGGDSGNLLAALADMRVSCAAARVRAELQEQKVAEFIDKLENPASRMVLKLRYCDCLEWLDRPRRRTVQSELAKAGLYYEKAQIFRLHGRALNEARELYKKEYEE